MILNTELEHKGNLFPSKIISYRKDVDTFYFTSEKGSVNTEHSNNPVPLLVINKSLKGKNIVLPQGGLSDLAPTILNLMNIAVPSGMKGRDLLLALQKKTW